MEDGEYAGYLGIAMQADQEDRPASCESDGGSRERFVTVAFDIHFNEVGSLYSPFGDKVIQADRGHVKSRYGGVPRFTFVGEMRASGFKSIVEKEAASIGGIADSAGKGFYMRQAISSDVEAEA